MYRCREADHEVLNIHKKLGLPGVALVCRVGINMGGQNLVACIDTGATFSLLAERMYEKIKDKLPPLQPPQVQLSGVG